MISKVDEKKIAMISLFIYPDDELIYALIVKNFSDSQIILDKKLINFICKRIARSYDKISEFICTIDEISLKKKKPINLKIIKEILGVSN